MDTSVDDALVDVGDDLGDLLGDWVPVAEATALVNSRVRVGELRCRRGLLTVPE